MESRESRRSRESRGKKKLDKELKTYGSSAPSMLPQKNTVMLA